MKERVLEMHAGESHDHESLSHSLNTMLSATTLNSILVNLPQEFFSLYLTDFVLTIRNTSSLPEQMCIHFHNTSSCYSQFT